MRRVPLQLMWQGLDAVAQLLKQDLHASVNWVDAFMHGNDATPKYRATLVGICMQQLGCTASSQRNVLRYTKMTWHWQHCSWIIMKSKEDLNGSSS